MPKNKEGFTLVEVLIALVIFSIMAIGFTKYVHSRVDQNDYLTDKTLAAIIASNAIAEIQINGQCPDTGQITKTITMAERSWQVTIDIEDSQYPDMRQLLVSVSSPASKTPLMTLTGFVGRH